MKWKRFCEFKGLKGAKKAGVYFLAVFHSTPPRRVSHTDPHIIYIGCAINLSRRLLHYRSAFLSDQNTHHQAGTRLANAIKGRKYKNRIPPWLYFLLALVHTKNEVAKNVQDIEFQYIWKFQRRNGILPVHNMKK